MLPTHRLALASLWCFFTQILFDFFKRATRCFGQEKQHEQQREHGNTGENKKGDASA